MKRIVVFMAIFASAAGAWAQTPSPPGTVLSASGGRYVFGQISDFQRDKFLLDTQTGRVWNLVCLLIDKDDKSKCLQKALDPIPFTNTNGDLLGVVPPAPGK